MYNYQNKVESDKLNLLFQFLNALQITYASTETQNIKQAQAWLFSQISLCSESLSMIKSILIKNYDEQLKIATVNFLKILSFNQKKYLFNQANFQAYCNWILDIITNDNCSFNISKSLSVCVQIFDQKFKKQMIPEIEIAVQLIQKTKSIFLAQKLFCFLCSMIGITDPICYPEIFQKQIIRLLYLCEPILDEIRKKIESTSNLQITINNKQELFRLQNNIGFIVSLIAIIQKLVQNKNQVQTMKIVKYSIQKKLNQNIPLYCLFYNILKLNFSNHKQIIFNFPKHYIQTLINSLKANVCYLFTRIFTTFQKQILQLCLETYFKNTNKQLDVDRMNIIQSMFIILEKCVTDMKFSLFIVSIKNDVIEHIFNYFSTQDQQIYYMINEPNYFITIQQDLCQERSMDEVIIKGVNFLVALAQKIDGALSYIIHLCILIIDDSINQTQKKSIEYDSIIKSLKKYEFWKQSHDKKIDSSLQVICCLQSLIQQRKSLRNNLLLILNKSILKYLPNAQSLSLCRIMLFCSYFPSKISTQWMMEFLKQTNQTIYEYHIFFYVKKLLNSKYKKQLLDQLRIYEILVLNHISCDNPLFEQFILHDLFILNDNKHQFIITKIVDSIKQFSLNNSKNQKIQNISSLLCLYLNKVALPVLYEKILLPLIQLLEFNTIKQSHIIPVLVTYTNRIKRISYLQSEMLRLCQKKLFKNQFSFVKYFEFIYLCLKYGDSITILNQLIDLMINSFTLSKSESQKSIITLILEIAILYSCNFKNTQNLIEMILQAIEIIWQKKHSHIVQNRLSEIVLCIFYVILKKNIVVTHGEFFSCVLKSHWLNKEIQLPTRDERKFHSIYLLQICQYFSKNKNQIFGLIESLLAIVIQNFENIQNQGLKSRSFSNFAQKFNQIRLFEIQLIKPIQEDMIDTINPKKALNYYSYKINHPLKQVDHYQIFKTKLNLIIKNQPYIFQSLQKTIMSQLYEKKIVNKQVRQILQLKK